MNSKQAQFVLEYLVDLNATQAAIRCGYSPKTAYSQGQRLLKVAEVKEAIEQRAAARADKLEITGERVLAAIAEIAFGDRRKIYREDGSLIPPHQWDDEAAAIVAGLDVVTVNKGEGAVEHVAKIRWADRLRALDMLARHHALYNDTVKVTGLDALAERLARASKRDV